MPYTDPIANETSDPLTPLEMERVREIVEAATVWEIEPYVASLTPDGRRATRADIARYISLRDSVAELRGGGDGIYYSPRRAIAEIRRRMRLRLGLDPDGASGEIFSIQMVSAYRDED